jgi:Putative Flp pilus-assembly TadE/G-like
MTDDRGSVLMLMPAAMLVMIVLAAITLDLGLVYLRRTEVAAAADAAANDAVTYGLDEAVYRGGGGYVLDPARVRAAVDRTIESHHLAGRLAAPPELIVTATTVQVRLTARVDFVFARALPGVDSTEVAATGTATAVAR